MWRWRHCGHSSSIASTATSHRSTGSMATGRDLGAGQLHEAVGQGQGARAQAARRSASSGGTSGVVASRARIEVCGERMSWVSSCRACSRWRMAAVRVVMSARRTIQPALSPASSRRNTVWD
jgi:hypothetical protein